MDTQGPNGQANQVAAVLDEIKETTVSALFLRANAKEAVASLNRKGENSDLALPHGAHNSGWADTMHELANSMTAVLINAQVLEWKLPPYSRLKRPVREIECHARRSGALLKHLLHQFAINQPGKARQELCGQIPSLHGAMAGATAKGLGPADDGPVKLPPPMRPPSAPRPATSSKGELTSMCDRCTSTSFPKEER
jgi:hypothetical protein